MDLRGAYPRSVTENNEKIRGAGIPRRIGHKPERGREAEEVEAAGVLEAAGAAAGCPPYGRHRMEAAGGVTMGPEVVAERR